MSWSRFLFVRFVKRRQHTSVFVARWILFRPFGAQRLFKGARSRGDALRACPWLSYCAPSALRPSGPPWPNLSVVCVASRFNPPGTTSGRLTPGYHIARLRRSAVRRSNSWFISEDRTVVPSIACQTQSTLFLQLRQIRSACRVRLRLPVRWSSRGNTTCNRAREENP